MKVTSSFGKDSVLFVSWRGNRGEVSSTLISDEIDPDSLSAGSTTIVVRVHASEVTSLEDYPTPLKLWWIAAIPPFVVFGECQLGSRLINPRVHCFRV